jgi:anti-sigma B factor antagonist
MMHSEDGTDLFRMEEQRAPDGELRLTLVGELDLAVASDFVERIASLRHEGRAVRIDLSRLEFLDSTGLRELIVAVTEARRDGWSLQLEPQLDGEVARIIDLVGARSFFWPE